jgi:hypothetical protein
MLGNVTATPGEHVTIDQLVVRTNHLRLYSSCRNSLSGSYA